MRTNWQSGDQACQSPQPADSTDAARDDCPDNSAVSQVVRWDALALATHCAAKVWWATDQQPANWYAALADFAKRQRLTEEADFWRQSQEALQPSGR